MINIVGICSPGLSAAPAISRYVLNLLGLNYKIVLADTGAIGGSGSHQFMAISEVGESNIIYCDCGYAADEEKAENLTEVKKLEEFKEIEKVHTPNQKSIEDVASFLNIDLKKIVKSMVYKNLTNNELVLALVRGDRSVNEIKVVNALGIAEHELTMATYSEILSAGSVEGFVGPMGFKGQILIDDEIKYMSNFVVGANEKDYHLINVNFERDFNGKVLQIRNTVAGDLCPVCHKPMSMERGIEVGQIFKLGTKYSASMNCTYQNEQGQNVPMIMGCYGIGVSRTMASIIEQYHDDFGIKWPLNVAPYHAVIVPINYNDETMKNAADELYEQMRKAHIEVVLDDRDAKAGFKFKDWELIGVPYIITMGRRAGEGICEFKNRHTMEKVEMSFEEAFNIVNNAVKEL